MSEKSARAALSRGVHTSSNESSSEKIATRTGLPCRSPGSSPWVRRADTHAISTPLPTPSSPRSKLRYPMMNRRSHANRGGRARAMFGLRTLSPAVRGGCGDRALLAERLGTVAFLAHDRLEVVNAPRVAERARDG